MWLPKPVIEGISSLLALPVDAFTALVSRLSSLRPNISFASDVAKAVEKEVPADVAANATHSILWLYSARIERKVPLADFVQSVLHGLQDAAAETDPEALRGRIEQLVGIPGIFVGYNSQTLFSEHERLLFSARVITDLRAVFSESDDAAPSHCMAVHTLRLRYRNQPEGAVRDFVVGIDESDIEDLIRALQRAKKKAAHLRRISATSGLQWFDSVRDQ